MSEPTDIIDTDPFDPEVVELYEQSLQKQIEDAPNNAVETLRRRNEAYTRIFTPGERTQADIDIVLADLAWFCRMAQPTYDIRDGIHAEELSKRKEGRREVFQRVFNFSRLELEPLLLMYTDATTK